MALQKKGDTIYNASNSNWILGLIVELVFLFNKVTILKYQKVTALESE